MRILTNYKPIRFQYILHNEVICEVAHTKYFDIVIDSGRNIFKKLPIKLTKLKVFYNATSRIIQYLSRPIVVSISLWSNIYPQDLCLMIIPTTHAL